MRSEELITCKSTFWCVINRYSFVTYTCTKDRCRSHYHCCGGWCLIYFLIHNSLYLKAYPTPSLKGGEGVRQNLFYYKYFLTIDDIETSGSWFGEFATHNVIYTFHCRSNCTILSNIIQTCCFVLSLQP